VSADGGRPDVETFLGKIDKDRRAEFESIRAEGEREVARLRSEAHAESRHFHREYADAARRAQRLERDRRLSRSRAELRRQRWQLLHETEVRAMARVKQLVLEEWARSERQREWCEYWLRRAMELSGTDDVVVRLGQGAQECTLGHLRRVVDEAGREAEIRIDPQQLPGIVVEWDHVLLDGGLYAQCPAVEDMIFSELTNWLHAGEAAGGDDHEQR
jgi:hypothetical protein